MLWKRTASIEFRAIDQKLCGKCAFPQNFNIRKFGEITQYEDKLKD